VKQANAGYVQILQILQKESEIRLPCQLELDASWKVHRMAMVLDPRVTGIIVEGMEIVC